MGQKIERDLGRFHKLLRGKIKSNLGKYISRGEMIGKKGDDLVSIPLPQIQLPQFRYGEKNSGGTGQGDGDIGQPLGPTKQDGSNGPGEEPGAHILEVELTMEELATMLGEQLELPNIEPKGKKSLKTESLAKMTPRHSQLPIRKHPKRTLREAILRNLASGLPPSELPKMDIRRSDFWNKDFQYIPKPDANAVLISMMDVSGSMTDEMKQIARIESWWISLWLSKFYPGLEKGYIIHDARAQGVDEHTFYHTRESGGTKISSAYELCARVAEGKEKLNGKLYPADEWNIYALHFCDGDNFAPDTKTAIDIVANRLLETVNLFGYIQLINRYGDGDFINELENSFADKDKVRTSRVGDRNGIPNSIKQIFGANSQVQIVLS